MYAAAWATYPARCLLWLLVWPLVWLLVRTRRTATEVGYRAQHGRCRRRESDRGYIHKRADRTTYTGPRGQGLHH